MFWFDCKITIFFLKMARKRTFSHFFFEKKCVFVPKSFIRQRIYLASMDRQGHSTKPFLLPQRRPREDNLRDPTAFFPHEWYTSDVYEQMEYSMLVRRQDWHAILDKAAKKAPMATASEAAVKLAQWKTGALSDEGMRQFMASYGKLDHPINICMKSDLFFHLGLVNASRRYAFEFKQLITNGNQSGRMLKRLAETELVSGHEQLARKYLYILHDATFYRQWAKDVLPLTRSVKLLDAHPLYGPLSHSFPEKDVMY